MINAEPIIREIELALTKLEQPLSQEDIKGGWRDKDRLAWSDYMCALRDKLRAHEAINPLEYNMSRGLAMNAIYSGPLSDDFARISLMIHQTYGVSNFK